MYACYVSSAIKIIIMQAPELHMGRCIVEHIIWIIISMEFTYRYMCQSRFLISKLRLDT